MKTMFYCQHSIGMGHLMRTLRLAEECFKDGPVRLICGGPIPVKLKIDPRMEVDALPPLIIGPRKALIDPFHLTDVDRIFERRLDQSAQAVREFSPDALVVEMFPFGRKKFAKEILSIIEASRESSNARLFSSVRDVLITSRRDQSRHDCRAATILNEHFDGVLVHSDPTLVSLDATFSALSRVRIPIHYTGYVSSNCASTACRRERTVIVSAGGGRVGRTLIEAAIDAAKNIKKSLGLDMVVVTGPLSNARTTYATGKGPAKRVEFIKDMTAVLERSTLSISQCGYNTAADVLKARIPAVFVPFETKTEDEQLHRADLLAGCGRTVTLRQYALTPETLIQAARQALGTAKKPQTAPPVSLDGARRSREIVSEWIGHA